jgi:hypothetical protein
VRGEPLRLSWAAGEVTSMYGYSDIGSASELVQQLDKAIEDTRRIATQYSGDRALQSIVLQLEAAKKWTSGGHPPTLEQKGRLNFGLLASKYLDEIDSDVAQRLYNIAEFITHWK